MQMKDAPFLYPVNKPAGSLFTLGLLVGFSLPQMLGRAQEPVPSHDAQHAIDREQTLTLGQRLELVRRIEKAIVSRAAEGRQVWADEIKQLLMQYKDSLQDSPDMSREELTAATRLAVLCLNSSSFRIYLPEPLKDKFVAEEVITLHAALIDRIQDIPADDPLRIECEQNAQSLLRDLLWCSHYKSHVVFEEACNIYGQRIFDCPASVISERTALLQSHLELYPTARMQAGLLRGILQFAEQHLNSGEVNPDLLSSLQALVLSFMPDIQAANEINEFIDRSLTSSVPLIALTDFVGPLAASALLNASESRDAANRIDSAREFMAALLSRDLALTLPEETPLTRLLPSLAQIALHSINGSLASEFDDGRPVKTPEDLERRQRTRLRCLAITLGMLSSIEGCLQTYSAPREYVIVGFKGIPVKYYVEPEPNGPALNDAIKQLDETLERLKTRLGYCAADGWSDAHRAQVVVQLLASDYASHSTTNEMIQYMKARRTQIGKYFPDVVVGNREGRYASKVGDNRYFPPIQVEGHPSAYADLYFYIREGLVSTKYKTSWLDLEAPDQALNSLALEYADACQTVFICSLIADLYGENPGIRPIEHHRGLSDARMIDEIIEILSDLPCFSDNEILKVKLTGVSAAEFFSNSAEMKKSAELTRDKLQKQIAAALGQ